MEQDVKKLQEEIATLQYKNQMLVEEIKYMERKATEARKAAVEAVQRFEELRETHTRMVGQIMELMGKLETLR